MPETIVTGSVHAPGDANDVPSLRYDENRRDFAGTLQDGELCRANIVMSCAALAEFGEFDPRVGQSAEDNGSCYGCLRPGRSLRCVPAMPIWHGEWRQYDQMPVLYARYGHGVFLAKHLRASDPRIVRFVVHNIWNYSKPVAKAVLRRRRPPASPWETLCPTPKGMRESWLTVASLSRGRGA